MSTTTTCEQCGGPGALPSAFGHLCGPCYEVHLPTLNEAYFADAAKRPAAGGNGSKVATRYSYPAEKHTEPERPPYRAEDLDAILAAEDEKLDVVIGDGDEGAVLTIDGKGAFVGPTGIGKTNLLIGAARCLCEGTLFLGLPVPVPRRVLYLALEGSRRGFRRRLRKRWDGADAEAGARFHLAHLSLNLTDEADLERLDTLLYEVRPDVLIIDSFREAHQLDENTSHDMARLTGILDGLIDRHHCAIILAHHDRKRPPFMRRDVGTDRVRGSTAFTGWLTFCLSLDADPSGPDRLVAEFTKTRDAETPLLTLSLDFDRETLGFTLSERTPGGKVSDEMILTAIFRAGGSIRGTDLIRGLVEGASAGERSVRERLRALAEAHRVIPFVAPEDRRQGAKSYRLPDAEMPEEEP